MTKADIVKSLHQLFVLVCVSEIVAAVYQILECYFTAHEHFRRDSFDLKCTDYGVDFPGGVGPGVSRKPVPLRHSVPEERRTSSCFASLCVQALHLPE